MKRIALAILLALLPLGAHAGQGSLPLYGLGAATGGSYAPDGGVGWFLLTGSALYEYGAVAPHPAPANLRFKAEGTIGVATAPDPRPVLSAKMLAQHLFEGWRRGGAVPYVEGGIGVIYTGFRREEQGLWVNWNPVAGAGLEFRDKSGRGRGWIAARFHHLSNGGLDEENRGLNSLLFQAGIYL